ncbi:MAG: hypothetical protein ACREH8_24225 [Opitutaceae bacterium]
MSCARLSEDDDTAAAALLADLCRHSSALRDWLLEDFGKNRTTRARFAQATNGGAALPSTNGADWFTSFTGENRAWQSEQAELRRRIAAPQLYGGLTWAEMEKLVRQYQAGAIDLGVFLLAHAWHSTRRGGGPSPARARASVAFFEALIRGGEKKLMSQLTAALRFLDLCAQAPKRRSTFGYADWWKLRALFYMLRHPRESYRTRYVCAHLHNLGARITAQDFRRFRTRHGIRRDKRAGRPRTRLAGPSGWSKTA